MIDIKMHSLQSIYSLRRYGGIHKLYIYDYKYLYQDYLIERFGGVSKPYEIYKQVDDVKMSINRRG